MANEKSEKATPERLRKAHEEGKYATSRDLLAACQLVLALALALLMGGALFTALENSSILCFRQAFVRQELTGPRAFAFAKAALMPVLVPFFEMAALLTTVSLFLQLTTTGFGFALKQLTPDFGRLNSFSRLKNLPAQNLFSSFKAVILIPVIGLVLYLVITPQMPDLLNLSGLGLGAGVEHARTLIESLVWRLLSVLLVFGVIDFARQKQKFAKDLRMSKQEIKEEVKQNDGNPQIKAQIRRIQRDRIRKNMIKAVPEANVVIVNPTHFSVAIKYESGSKTVPVVLAKGQDHLALLIRERAREHNVPLVENKPLARALYDAVEVGQEIPPHLYRAVAEVLAHIYRTLDQR